MIRPDPKWFAGIESTLDQFFFEAYYKPILEIINMPLQNARNELVQAIRNGIIKYSNGVFTGQFNAKTSSQLSEFASYDARRKQWNAFGIVPGEVVGAAMEANVRVEQYLKDIENTLGYMDDFASQESEKLTFNIKPVLSGVAVMAAKALLKAGADKDRAAPTLIPTSEDSLTRDYVDAMQFNIKGWNTQQIDRFREMIRNAKYSQIGRSGLVDMIQAEHQITKAKARFYARNETSLLVTHIRDQRFKDAGVISYNWSAINDGRQGERQHYTLLHGKTFFYSAPPIIDFRTGKRGNPGQTYNCRCQAIPSLS